MSEGWGRDWAKRFTAQVKLRLCRICRQPLSVAEQQRGPYHDSCEEGAIRYMRQQQQEQADDDRA